MRTRQMKIAIVALLGAVLIVGSFVTDNFGISKAYVGWDSLYPPAGDGYVCYDFGGCHFEASPQAPYAQQYWSVDQGLEWPPTTLTLALITLAALIMTLTPFMANRQTQDFHYQQSEALQAPWKSPFKKHKYTAIPSLKRHPLHDSRYSQQNSAKVTPSAGG